MILDTPLGKRELPDCFLNEYLNKTDVELLDTLIKQYKRFLDPVLIQVLTNKGLIDEHDNYNSISQRLNEMKKEGFHWYRQFCKIKNLIPNKYDSLQVFMNYKRCFND